MKKPVKAAAAPAQAAGKAAQPGNAPGRGKSAHVQKAAPKKVPAKVKAARHAAAVKAAKTRAANAKKAKHHPKRMLALGEGVACCAAEALAASLRLAGRPVSDEDVLALYWRTADSADAGASVLATLEAASRFGLAGSRPSFGEGPAGVGAWRRLVLKPQSGCHPPPGFPDITRLWPASTFRGPALVPGNGLLPTQGLILGVSIPAAHAVLATPDGWWSWGELYEPWTDDIDEAWEVAW